MVDRAAGRRVASRGRHRRGRGGRPPPGRRSLPDAALGPVRIVGATVEHTRDGERRVVAVAETSDGARTVVVRTDEESIAAGLAGELVGTTTVAVQT